MTNPMTKEQPTITLLPCPFCGSANIDAAGWASQTSSGPACDDCGASAGSTLADTPEANIAAWNTRTTSLAAQDGLVEAALTGDAEDICAGISDEAIEAGIAAWDNARQEMEAREQALDPENHRDWDEGMIVAAIFKAVSLSAIKGDKS